MTLAPRRLLVRALSLPPRKRPESAPRFARLAAILASCFRQVSSELASLVLDEFEQVRPPSTAFDRLLNPSDQPFARLRSPSPALSAF